MDSELINPELLDLEFEDFLKRLHADFPHKVVEPGPKLQVALADTGSIGIRAEVQLTTISLKARMDLMEARLTAFFEGYR